MSTCPQCYTGTCKRHQRQDHGRSVVKSANAESTLKKMYEQLVGSKLQKLQAEAEKDPSRQHAREFRKKLDASRDKTMRQSHKSRAKLSADVTGSGLNPQALAAVYADDSDSDASRKRRKEKKKKNKKASSSGKRKRRSDSDSKSDSDSDDHRRKRHKKHKKSHKKKHKRSRNDE